MPSTSPFQQSWQCIQIVDRQFHRYSSVICQIQHVIVVVNLTAPPNGDVLIIDSVPLIADSIALMSMIRRSSARPSKASGANTGQRAGRSC